MTVAGLRRRGLARAVRGWRPLNRLPRRVATARWENDNVRSHYAHQATVTMVEAADPAAIGGAVTVALCGHWEHEPPCPLAPHFTRVDRVGDTISVRILFATEPDHEREVRELIDEALRSGSLDGESATWTLASSGAAEIAADERDHAQRLSQ